MARRNVIEIVIEGTDRATGVLEGIAKSLDNVTQNLTRTGTALAGATAPLVAGLGAAVNNAMRFEEAMTNANAILQVSNAEVTTLSDEILDMAADSRAGPQAVAESFYDIVSGVADASTHMAILDAAISTSEAGAADLGATTSALIGVMNAYGFEADEAARVSDIFTATVGSGVLTMNELAGALPTVTGLAASQGIALEELAGALALITTEGTPAAQAATQLQAATTALIAPNSALQEAYEELGVASGDALIEQYGLVGALEQVAGTTAAAENGLLATLGSVEALNATLAVLGDDAPEFLEDFVEGIDGATASALEIQNASLAAEFDKMQSSLSVLSIIIGSVFTPTLTEMVRTVGEGANALAQFAAENPEVIRVVGEAAVVVFALGSAMASVGPAVAAATFLIGGVLNPIGALITASTLLGAAYTRNWLGFGDAVDTGVSRARSAIESASGFLGDLFSSVSLPDLSAVAAAIGDALGNLNLSKHLGKLSSTISKAIAGVEIPKIDFSLQGIAVSEDVLDAIVAGLGIVFGGPVGMAIGVAKLTAIAFETDFLGFRGLVENSGILEHVTGGVDAIFGFAKAVIAGGEGSGEQASQMAQAFVTSMGGALEAAAGMTASIASSATTLAVDVFGEIVSAVASIDPAGLGFALGVVIGTVLRGVVDASVAVGTAVADLAGDILGELVTAIVNLDGAAIVTALGNLITGALQLNETVYTALAEFGGGLLDGIATGITGEEQDVTGWVSANLIMPIADALGNVSLESLIGAAAGIGESIMTGVGDGISSMVGVVESAFKSAINDIIPNSIGMTLSDPTGIFGDQSVSFSVPDPFPGYALGGMYPGGPMLVGERGPELLVPGSSGMVVSNNQLGTAMNVMAGRMAEAMNTMATLDAQGGGGDVYIDVEIPLDYMRDGNVVRNADTFAAKVKAILETT